MSPQRGSVVLWFALMLPVLIAMVGLATDAGYLYDQRQRLQAEEDFTGRTARDVLHAVVTQLVGALGLADLLLTKPDLLVAAQDRFARLMHPGGELGAQVLVGQMGQLGLGLDDPLALTAGEVFGQVPAGGHAEIPAIVPIQPGARPGAVPSASATYR